MDQLEPDVGTLIKTEYGNTYGCFQVCLIDGHPRALVEGYGSGEWRHCSWELYEAVRLEAQQ